PSFRERRVAPAARDPGPRPTAARAADVVRVRRPLPAGGRSLPSGPGAPEHRLGTPRCLLSPGARMTNGASAPALEVVDLVKHFPVGRGLGAGGRGRAAVQRAS